MPQNLEYPTASACTKNVGIAQEAFIIDLSNTLQPNVPAMLPMNLCADFLRLSNRNKVIQ